MVGPFMQGILLMGIIYWYSKSMMSMINDYYRSEFQQKLKRETPRNESASTFDIDDFENLLNIDGGGPLQGLETVTEKMVIGDIPGTQRGVCVKRCDYAIFIDLVLAKSNAMKLAQFCWTNRSTGAVASAM